MTLQSAVRKALAAVQRKAPNAVVSVVIDGVSGTGLRDTVSHASAPTMLGERGEQTGAVRVSLETFAVPVLGATIIVGGERVIVTNAKPDPVSGNMTVEYGETQPVTGVL